MLVHRCGAHTQGGRSGRLRSLILALLQDLGCLGVRGNAMLQRLAQLDPGRRQPDAALVVDGEAALDHPLADLRLPGIQLDALVDAVQHLQQRKVFEGNLDPWPSARAVRDEVVPEIGIEPTTYALRMRRSTN